MKIKEAVRKKKLPGHPLSRRRGPPELHGRQPYHKAYGAHLGSGGERSFVSLDRQETRQSKQVVKMHYAANSRRRFAEATFLVGKREKGIVNDWRFRTRGRLVGRR